MRYLNNLHNTCGFCLHFKQNLLDFSIRYLPFNLSYGLYYEKKSITIN